MVDSSSIIVPDDLRKQFPGLIDLIIGSESMNDEERQYWINILPVMTPEQRDNLQGILQNERDQLSAIDARYQKEMRRVGGGIPIAELDKRIKGKRDVREEAEIRNDQSEKEREEAILRAIAEL